LGLDPLLLGSSGGGAKFQLEILESNFVAGDVVKDPDELVTRREQESRSGIKFQTPDGNCE